MNTNAEQKGPIHVREINRARQFYNPLVGLDMPRLRQLLEQGERGLNSALQDLYRIAEKRHATLLALKTRRTGAVTKLEWDIKIPSRLPRGISQAQAEAQADFLREAYDAIEDLSAARDALAIASFRGYAHLEKHFQDDDPNLPVVKLQSVPQWHMLRSSEDWSWVYDATARNNASTAVPIDPANFIIREVEAPLDEIGVICFLRSSLAEKDWTSFVEDFGLPSIFGILAPNTPLDKVQEWLAVMEKVTGNSRGALPPGSDLKFVTPGTADGTAFEKFLKHQDEVLVLAGTCGLLTMLTASGSGTLAGSAHQEAFDVLALAEAMEISAIFQTQFDKPLLAREFPSQPVAAYFQLAAIDEEDLDALAKRLQFLASAGLLADPEEVSEKLGLTLTRGSVAAPTAQVPGDAAATDMPAAADKAPMMNRASMVAGMEERFLSASERQLAAADLLALAPIINRVSPIRAELVRLDGLDDAGFAAGVQKLQPQLDALRRDLPELERQVLTDHPQLDQAFTDIFGTAFVSGAVQAAAIRQPLVREAAKSPRSVSGVLPPPVAPSAPKTGLLKRLKGR